MTIVIQKKQGAPSAKAKMENVFGIPDSLKKLDIKVEDVLAVKDDMIQAALADTCTATNPRKADAADIETILGKVTPL